MSRIALMGVDVLTCTACLCLCIHLCGYVFGNPLPTTSLLCFTMQSDSPMQKYAPVAELYDSYCKIFRSLHCKLPRVSGHSMIPSIVASYRAKLYIYIVRLCDSSTSLQTARLPALPPNYYNSRQLKFRAKTPGQLLL